VSTNAEILHFKRKCQLGFFVLFVKKHSVSRRGNLGHPVTGIVKFLCNLVLSPLSRSDAVSN